jgi:serine/threonine protein phosphatase PrpC
MIKLAVCERQGCRQAMEDRHLVVADLLKDSGFSGISGRPVQLVAIFDGHGGSRSADLLHQHFETVLRQCILAQRDARQRQRQDNDDDDNDWDDKDDYSESLINAFRICDVLLRQDYEQRMNTPDRYDSGSTAGVVLLVGDMVYCANVGDTEVVVGGRGGSSSGACDSISINVLSTMHKPSFIAERKRVEDAGGFVTLFSGVARVCGILAVSRAFGNFNLQAAASQQRVIDAVPSVSSCRLADDQVLIIACDGLWDVYAYADAVRDALQQIETGGDPALYLTQQAIDARYSRDNVTTIVISK